MDSNPHSPEFERGCLQSDRVPERFRFLAGYLYQVNVQASLPLLLLLLFPAGEKATSGGKGRGRVGVRGWEGWDGEEMDEGKE